MSLSKFRLVWQLHLGLPWSLSHGLGGILENGFIWWSYHPTWMTAIMPSMLLRRLKLWAVEIAMTWQEMEFSTLCGVWWKMTCPSRLLRCFAAFLYTWHQQKYQQKHASLCSVFIYWLTFFLKIIASSSIKDATREGPTCLSQFRGLLEKTHRRWWEQPLVWGNTDTIYIWEIHDMYHETLSQMTIDLEFGYWIQSVFGHFWSPCILTAEVYTPMSHGLWFLLPKYNLEKLCWIPCVAQECSWQKHHIAVLSLEPHRCAEMVGLVVCSDDCRKYNPTKNRLD